MAPCRANFAPVLQLLVRRWWSFCNWVLPSLRWLVGAPPPLQIQLEAANVEDCMVQIANPYLVDLAGFEATLKSRPGDQSQNGLRDGESNKAVQSLNTRLNTYFLHPNLWSGETHQTYCWISACPHTRIWWGPRHIHPGDKEMFECSTP